MIRRTYVLPAIGLLLLAGCGAESVAPTNQSEDRTESVATASAALAQGIDCSSAHRDPSVDWRVYFEACVPGAVRQLPKGATATPSPMAAATAIACGGCSDPNSTNVGCRSVPATQVNFDNVPEWDDCQIEQQFQATRDARFLHDATYPQPDPRRISWLYPNDGCFARSELAASMAEQAVGAKPFKLFSMGNLVVSTPNSPTGQVTWAWHVVPVVKSRTSQLVYVLDPAIDPSGPMTWDTWLLKQVPTLNDACLTVADGNAYKPCCSNVSGDPSPQPTALQDEQLTYLGLEYFRQTSELSPPRDPLAVFGNQPPWAGGPLPKEYSIDVNAGVVLSACLTCRCEEVFSPRCLSDCPIQFVPSN